MKATAAILPSIGTSFVISEIELEDPRHDEVRVRILAAGICHTDLAVASGAFGDIFPAVLGHEGCGIVEAVGADVGHVVPGDLVVLSFQSCGRCPPCADSASAYCTDFAMLNISGRRADGSTPILASGTPVGGAFFGQSSFATHVIAHARNTVKVMGGDAAWLAPLGCSVQTGAGAVLTSLAVQAKERIAVFGCGAVGMSAILAARMLGCAEIVAIDPVMSRRELAREMGATMTFAPTADAVPAILSAIPGGFDAIVETSGRQSAAEMAAALLGVKGRLGMIGAPETPDATLHVPVLLAIARGLTVRGICEGDSEPHHFIPQLVSHVVQGRLPLQPMIRTYPFDQINAAIADLRAGHCVKAVLVFN